MGFMKKFFSLGSKKGKKTSKHMQEVTAREYSSMPTRAQPSIVPLSVVEHEVQKRQSKEDAEANYLLRSSSSHYKVVSEFDYSNMPPLPHPINRLVTGSTLSLTSTATSATKPAYTVKVHPKTVLAEAEYSDKSYSSDTQDTSLLLRLHADPSVVSLLNMYDNHGDLPDQAFADSSVVSLASPLTSDEPLLSVGRVQVKRSGSTLRQLLGEPDETDGEISWAERHLKEAETSSIDSSVGLKTPTDLNTRFLEDNISCVTSNLDTPHDSLEHTIGDVDANATHEIMDSRTPFHAAEVFAFITNKARNPHADIDTRTRHSSPPLLVDNTPQSRFSSDSSDLPSPSTSQMSSSTSQSFDSDTQCIVQSVFATQESRILDDSTKSVDLLPRTKPISPRLTSRNDSKLPRLVSIPSPPSAPRRSYESQSMSLALAERSANVDHSKTPEDFFSPIPVPTKMTRSKHWPRRASNSRKPIPPMDKENARPSLDSAAPPVSLRLDSRQLKRLSAPSPTSSSELSPVGLQLMKDVRAQKAGTRAKENGAVLGPSRRH